MTQQVQKINAGGTGKTTAQDAIDALTDVVNASNEQVLTKDTATGKAKFKNVPAGVPAPTATNDFLAGEQVGGVWSWVKKTLAEVKTILGLGGAAYLYVGTGAGDVAAGNKGVTNGDSHDHNGGDGAQIAYSTLSGTPPAGWEFIEDKYLSSGDGIFDFTSVPSTYKHLIIILSARSDRAGAYTDGVLIKFNNDAGNNYTGMIQYTGGGKVEQTSAGGPPRIAWTCAASTPANYFSNSVITIADYANANKYPSFQGRGYDLEVESAGGIYIYDGGGHWLSLTAVNRITIYPVVGTNYKQYSRATLYGCK